MAAAVYDVKVEQGATFRFPKFQFGTLKVLPDGTPDLDADGNQQIDEGRDFTGCKFRCQMRKNKKTTAEVIFTVTSEDTDGGISFSLPPAVDAGTVFVVVPDELTDLVTKDGFWDLKVYNPDGTEDRLVEGQVIVNLGVTVDETTP